MWFHVNSSKESSEEVKKSIDVSLNHIYTYHLEGERTLIIGQTTDSDGGGVTESLSSELKNVGRICVLYSILNFCLKSQSKALNKNVELVHGEGVLGEISFMRLLHMFSLTQEALGEDFKYTWVRVNPNYPMHFMSDITNK